MATYSGPGNYVVAHDFAEAAKEARGREDLAEATVLAAIAQVHATLALTAATALHEERQDIQAWRDVTGME